MDKKLIIFSKNTKKLMDKINLIRFSCETNYYYLNSSPNRHLNKIFLPNYCITSYRQLLLFIGGIMNILKFFLVILFFSAIFITPVPAQSFSQEVVVIICPKFKKEPGEKHIFSSLKAEFFFASATSTLANPISMTQKTATENINPCNFEEAILTDRKRSDENFFYYARTSVTINEKDILTLRYRILGTMIGANEPPRPLTPGGWQELFINGNLPPQTTVTAYIYEVGKAEHQQAIIEKLYPQNPFETPTSLGNISNYVDPVEKLTTVFGDINKRTALPMFTKKIFEYGTTLAATLTILLTVYGGFLYMASGGNSDNISNAKKWIYGAFTSLCLLIIARILFATIGLGWFE